MFVCYFFNFCERWLRFSLLLILHTVCMFHVWLFVVPELLFAMLAAWLIMILLYGANGLLWLIIVHQSWVMVYSKHWIVVQGCSVFWLSMRYLFVRRFDANFTFYILYIVPQMVNAQLCYTYSDSLCYTVLLNCWWPNSIVYSLPYFESWW
jgi:hypothetical protein